MQKVRKAVIPAAGLGTRFLPITKVIPKELLPIGNKPAIQFIVEELTEAGIEEIIFVINDSKKLIGDYFGSNSEFKTEFTFVNQTNPKGLGDAVLCAKDAVGGEPFLVALPDVLMVQGACASKELIDLYEKNGKATLILENVPLEKVVSYGIANTRSARAPYIISGFVEKPKIEDAPSTLSVAGRYLFPNRIFSILEDTRPDVLGEVQLTDAMNFLAQLDGLLGFEFTGKVYDVGTPKGLLVANQKLFS